MFFAVMFLITKSWNRLKCSSVKGWGLINCDISIKMECCATTKINEEYLHMSTWTDLKHCWMRRSKLHFDAIHLNEKNAEHGNAIHHFWIYGDICTVKVEKHGLDRLYI